MIRVIFLAFSVKLVLNSRQEKVEFYSTIVPLKDVILHRGEGVDVMEVDKDNLEEAEAATNFVEKARVFDKAPDTESSPPIERTPPQALEPSMPKCHI